MAVEYNYIWLSTLIMSDPNAFKARLTLMSVLCIKLCTLDTCRLHLSPSEGGSEIAMSQHPKAEEWQRNLLREEDSANICRHVRKSIPHTSYDKVLERRCTANERRLTLRGSQIPFMNELKRQLQRWDDCVSGHRQT
jgi:hypothetical protein